MRLCSFALCLCLTSSLVAADEERQRARQNLSSTIVKLDDTLTRLHRLPSEQAMVVGLVADGRPIYRRALGKTHIGATDEVNFDTRFRLASLSKGFASALTVVYAQDGALTLDDRIKEWVPYLLLPGRNRSGAVTFEHLLSHRVGLPHHTYDNLLEAGWSPETIIRRFPLTQAPCRVGDCYGYQNVAYNLVAEALAVKQGVAYESQVEDRLLRPLTMRRSGLGFDHLQRDENWARPHVLPHGTAAPGRLTPHYYRVPAAAGVNASLNDMMIWLNAQLGHHPDVLDAAALELLYTPQVETRREYTRGGWRAKRIQDAHYGLGFRIYDYRGGPEVIFHAGAVSGYRAAAFVIPEYDVGMVALWNSNSGRAWGLTPLVVDSLLGRAPEDWLKLSPLAQSGYAQRSRDQARTSRVSAQ